tara:strand:- start:39 stop:302 length:264 start_codon:yes stop_codon:yes gene_type:complete
MSSDIDQLKKKIIYRSTYRGSKEMDNILFGFVNKYIENLNNKELINLLNLINLDDENLFKFNKGLKTDIDIPVNRITNLYKNYLHKK